MDCGAIELGFIVNLKSLREVLRSLSNGGRQWWFAADPVDAFGRGYLTIGYGYPDCAHPLNAAYFRIPILNKVLPRTGVDDVVVAIGSEACIAEQTGTHFEDGAIVPSDLLETFQSFYSPIKTALLLRLQAKY